MLMAVPSLGAIAASFTVLLRAACLEKLPRASPEFNLRCQDVTRCCKCKCKKNLTVLTRVLEGPLEKVRVALQSREAANIFDLQ